MQMVMLPKKVSGEPTMPSKLELVDNKRICRDCL
jgi:hypothetical protein